MNKKNKIWENYKKGTKLFETYLGKKYHATDIAAILLGVAAPFLGMLFPGVTVGILEGGRSAGMKLLWILIFALGIKVINVLQQIISTRQYGNYFQGRIRGADILNDHAFNMDYQKRESKEGTQITEAAGSCFYRGNDYGCEHFLKQGPLLVQNLIGFILYSCIVYRINLWVFLYMIVTSILLSYLSLRVGAYEKKTNDDMMKLYYRKGRAFAETFDQDARPDMILYKAKPMLLKKLNEVLAGFQKYFKGYYRVTITGNLASAFVNFLRDLFIYLLLIREIATGMLSVSELLIFVGTIAGYSAWMQGMMVSIQGLIQNSPIMTQLWDFLDFGNPTGKETDQVSNRGNAHEIRLEDVSYIYEGTNRESVAHVNLTIHPGEKLALVGANGAGKSTLVKLISGLYQPTSGKIFLDGVDAASYSREAYFAEFAAVFQNAGVFACSVADNVSCASITDRALVEECLKQADLWEKIESLPKGIDAELTTNLYPEGVNLSGGETQRLMLARALYRKASVLLLDEPTAALDPLAESHIYEHYDSMSRGKTALFISHRLSSTLFCDRVCFLKDGQITEIGTHQELLAAGKDYANMFQTQAKYYQEHPQGEQQEGDLCYE